MTEDTPQLHVYFNVGKEVVAFTDRADMIKQITYYLEHQEEADAIRRAGREKVINYYTWDKVWPKVLATVIGINGWKKDTRWIQAYLPEYKKLP